MSHEIDVIRITDTKMVNLAIDKCKQILIFFFSLSCFKMFSVSFGFGLLVRQNLIRSPWALQIADLVLQKIIKYLIKYFVVLEKGH